MPVCTSDRYKDTVKNPARIWRLKLKIHPDSELEPFELTEADVTRGSLSFDEASVGAGMLDIGSTYSNSLQFALENPDGKYNNLSFTYARVLAWVGLLLDPKPGDEGEVWEDIPLGEFFVQEEGRKMSTIPLTCLDRMVQLNAPVKRLITTPLTTAKEVIETMRLKYGFSITVETQSLIDTYTVPLDTEVISDDMTCRDFIGYCAAGLAMNARFNRTCNLEFFQHHVVPEGVPNEELDSSVVRTTPNTRLTGFTYSDRLIQVDGISVKDAYENTVSIPSEEETEAEAKYVISVSTNPLLLTNVQLLDAAQRIYDMYVATPYINYSASVAGDPAIQAGDPVRHINVNGTDKHVDSIITKHTFKFRGSSSIAAEGKPAEANRQMTATNKKIVEASMSASRDLNDRIWSMDELMQMQFSTVANSLGFYTEVIRDETTGAVKEFIIRDTNPKLGVEPTCSWKFDGENFYTQIGDKVTAGITDDGTMFAQRVLTQYLKTGSIESADGSVKIDLDNGAIVNRCGEGSTELGGETVLIQFTGEENTSPLSAIKLLSGQQNAEGKLLASIQFLDKNSTILSSITQEFYYDTEGGTVSGPLAVTDLKVNSTLEVANAILYDKIQLQRKSGEVGNTGVDFVIVGG